MYNTTMPRDDDDLDQPLSSRRALERSDHGKKDQETKRLKKEVQRSQMQKLKREMLKKDVHGSVIVRKDPDDKKTFGPKTHEDQAAQQYQSANEESANPDEMIKKEEEAEQIRRQSKEERQSEPG
jgi:hypothetical protein